MNSTTTALTALFNRIPRRHSVENLKEIKDLIAGYEDILMGIEAMNSFYEKSIPVFFNDLEEVRATVKKSADNKASKRLKDNFFDEASGKLKDSIQSLIEIYADGSRS